LSVRPVPPKSSRNEFARDMAPPSCKRVRMPNARRAIVLGMRSIICHLICLARKTVLRQSDALERDRPALLSTVRRSVKVLRPSREPVLTSLRQYGLFRGAGGNWEVSPNSESLQSLGATRSISHEHQKSSRLSADFKAFLTLRRGHPPMFSYLVERLFRANSI
jgi:hypothetical protein